MDSKAINTRVNHVAVVRQNFELDQVVGNLRRLGQVERLNRRTVFIVSEVALKKKTQNEKNVKYTWVSRDQSICWF
jgi:hypothetical protein